MWKWDIDHLHHATRHCKTLQHAIAHCNNTATSLQHSIQQPIFARAWLLIYTTLEHTATHWQDTATHYSALQKHRNITATQYTRANIRESLTSHLHHTAPHCNTLQHIATRYNALPKHSNITAPPPTHDPPPLYKHMTRVYAFLWHLLYSFVRVCMCGYMYSCVWYESFVCIHTFDMAHACVWHDSFIWVKWTTCMLRLDLLICAAWTHAHTWMIERCVTWLIHMKWNQLHVCHDSDSYVLHQHTKTLGSYLFIWVKWITCVPRLNSLICAAWTHEDTWIIRVWMRHVCDMTHSYGWYELHVCHNSH